MTTTVNNEHKNIKVPNLRFPEFQGEWEVESIKDVADFMGGGTPSSSNESFWQGTIPWVSSSDIVENDIKNISISRYITEEAIAHSATKLCPAPSILIVSRVGVGKIALSKKAICTSQDFCNLINIKVDPIFLTYCLSQIMKRKSMEVQGTSIKGITTSEIQKISINIPSLQEQKKIGKILSLLDERIATQNKIIDKLQSLIKGLRVRLIQIENGNIVHLGEIAQIYQPQTISSTELTEDGFLVYGANGIIGKYKEYNHKTEQICITCRGNTCGMVNYTKPMSWITGNAMVINTDEHPNKVCKRYLYHYLSAYNFNSIISGSGQPQIVRTPLEKLEITLPSIFEQEQKVMLLDRIQAKIEISNRVLSLYQGQKQYLLRQMFI